MNNPSVDLQSVKPMLKLIDGDKIPVISLDKYFSQRRTLIIPPWQREYSWEIGEDSQVYTLLEDLRKFTENRKVNQYLIGSVILCEESSSNDTVDPLLIDGQQRTLTFTLFLMCARKYLRVHNLIDGRIDSHNKLSHSLLKCLTENPEGAFRPKVQMTRSGADKILAELFDWSGNMTDIGSEIFRKADDENKTERNLRAVAKYIYDQFQTGEWVSQESFITALEKILAGVRIIELTVTDKRESISIFDRINDRGMVLSKADIIKNLIFTHVPDGDFDAISDNWNEMAQNLIDTKKVRLQDPKYLLRAMSHYTYGAHPGYDDLADFWEKKFDDKADLVTAKEFSNNLPKVSRELLGLVSGKSSKFGDISEIYLAAELGSVQHYSILLAGQKLVNEATYRKLLEQVNARTLLYMLSKERTQIFDALVPDWAFAIHELDPEAQVEDVVRVYNEVANPLAERFNDLKLRMSEWTYTNAGDRKKIRAVLAMLSSHLNVEANKFLNIQDAMRTKKIRGGAQPWHIDHIYPQAKSKESENPIWQSIGNLVLLSPSENSFASDAFPSEKNAAYNQSELLLTKTLSNAPVSSYLEKRISEVIARLNEGRSEADLISSDKWSLKNWNEDSVAARAEFYSSYFCDIIRSVSIK